MSILKIKASDGSWVGIPGIKGPKGDDGVTPNITFQVEELATGSPATITNSGTTENPIIKLGLPKGSNGADADTSTVVSKTGSRGTLAGYQTPTLSSSNITINQDSNSGIELTTASTITVNPGTEGTSWIKNVLIKNASTAVSLGDSWVWSGGEPPTIEENSRLTLCWNNDLGVATLLKGGAKVIKGIIKNVGTAVTTYAVQKPTLGGYLPVEIYRKGDKIYTIDNETEAECYLAVGDTFLTSDSVGTFSVESATGITFDSNNGYAVTSLQENFVAEVMWSQI